jgi:hypothetical protein
MKQIKNMINILKQGFLGLLLLLLFASISNGQVYKKGGIVVDGFYGFPNAMFSKWSTLTSNYPEYSNAKATSLGPIGGRVEYLVTDKIGIGLEGSYAHTIIDYNFEDPNSSTSDPYEVTITRFRILPRFNLHFGNHSKADPYIAAGLGYYYRTVVFTPNNPIYGYVDPSNNLTFNKNWPFSNALVIPIAFTAKFGFRYFFNEHIGLGTEVGIGGPLATLGLTIKL